MTVSLGLLIATWSLLMAAPVPADGLAPPSTWTPSPKITRVPRSESPLPASGAGDDGRTRTLAVAGAVVLLVAGGSAFVLRRVSQAAEVRELPDVDKAAREENLP